MKLRILFITALLPLMTLCSRGPVVDSGGIPVKDVLIKKRYISDNSYLIICKGYPKKELEGVSRIESSKRAALLNAYYIIKMTFNDTVAPDKDGRVEKFIIRKDYVIVHYIISKQGLRGRER